MKQHAHGRPGDMHIVLLKKVQHLGDDFARVEKIRTIVFQRPFFEATPVEFEVEGDDEGALLQLHKTAIRSR